MCISTSLAVNDTSLILASVDADGVYKAERTYSPTGWQQVLEYAEICGVQKLYPLGTCVLNARRSLFQHYTSISRLSLIDPRN